MSDEVIEIEVSKSEPNGEVKSIKYNIPKDEVITVLDSLDYVRRNIDSSIGYYCHQACGQGMCGVCNIRINGIPKLACETKVENGMVLEPLLKRNIVVDLVNKIQRR